MSVVTQEARIILAIEAIYISKKLSCQKAIKIYIVPESLLRLRINSYISLPERWLANLNLLKLKKEVIV